MIVGGRRLDKHEPRRRSRLLGLDQEVQVEVNLAAFGWHATIFIGWGLLAVVAVGVLAAAMAAKLFVGFASGF